MAKYMILFNSDATARELMANASPEEMKASMDEWVKWRDEAIKSVKFEFGLPLQAVNSISPEAATESRNPASGYATIEGDSKDVITQLLKTHPHLKRTGSSIDLLEMIPMPGM